MEFSGKRSFIIYKMLKAISAEKEDFNRAREQLIRKYAETDENGELVINDGTIQVPNENLEKFQMEIQEILSTEVTMHCDRISIDWLEDIQLTPQEIFSMEAFIE